MVSALKFEWALNNPHVTLHIPTASRITVSTQRKRGGHLKRPRHNITSIISNIHLLLGVPSFARLPLKLHFFAAEVHRVWTKYLEAATEPLHRTIPVFTDFAPSQDETGDGASTEPLSPWGIHALPLDYAPMKSYVEKTQELYSFEREGACVVCGESLPHDEGLYATCSNTGCEGTGHVACWSRHLLGDNVADDIIPVSGHCPRCEGEVVWGDMMMEMSLRLRGQKEIDRLFKKPRRKKALESVDST